MVRYKWIPLKSGWTITTKTVDRILRKWHIRHAYTDRERNEKRICREHGYGVIIETKVRPAIESDIDAKII